jgi:lipopolysaccharide transport system permease protein
VEHPEIERRDARDDDIGVVEERTPAHEFVFDGVSHWSPVTSARELWEYRECVWSFGMRSLRVRYKQAALGLAWAVLQPLAFLTVFVVFFGRVAGVESPGSTYAAFAISAIVPWQFVSSSVAFGGDSLIQDAGLLRKVYFPREAPVFGAVGSYLPDLGIGLVIVLLAVPFTDAHITWTLVFLPLLIAAIILPAIAVSVPIAGLAVYYRDFKYALPFAIQVWLFASPVAYPVTQVDPSYRWLYALLDPVVGPLEGFRRVLAVGTTPDWGLLALSALSAALLVIVGQRVFKRLEAEFADIV